MSASVNFLRFLLRAYDFSDGGSTVQLLQGCLRRLLLSLVALVTSLRPLFFFSCSTQCRLFSLACIWSIMATVMRPTASQKTHIQSALGRTQAQFSIMKSSDGTPKSKATILRLKATLLLYRLETWLKSEDKQSLITKCERNKRERPKRCFTNATSENFLTSSGKSESLI